MAIDRLSCVVRCFIGAITVFLCCALGAQEALAQCDDYWPDGDGDEYGDEGAASQCSEDPIPGWVTQAGDCKDDDEAINPDADEVCDGDDNNCDGDIDEGWTYYYVDLDEDGYGNDTVPQVCQEDMSQASAVGGDCDDSRASANPGEVEVCDGVDNNCDGDTDEGLLELLYRDADGDGYGAASSWWWWPWWPPPALRCPSPGWVSNNTDCRDWDRFIHPGAVEVCDGRDNNCNWQIDEGLRSIRYRDYDGDGYGNSPSGFWCPEWWNSAVNTDCDDSSDSVYPDANELCNGTDDDCDGDVDEEPTPTWGWLDKPCKNKDYKGICEAGTYACINGNKKTCVPNIMPGTVEEVCNCFDDDCDGDTDEGEGGRETGAPCTIPDGIGICKDGIEVCECDGRGIFCDAPQPGEIHEDCNGLDDDCDTIVDELTEACGEGMVSCTCDQADPPLCKCLGVQEGSPNDCAPGCPIGSLCNGETCVPYCDADHGCGAGEVCDTYNARCVRSPEALGQDDEDQVLGCTLSGAGKTSTPFLPLVLLVAGVIFARLGSRRR